MSEAYTEGVRRLRKEGIGVLKVAQRYISDPELAAALFGDDL